MTAALDFNTIARISASRMVDCLAQGSLVAIVAALGLLLVRRQRAGIRFTLWFSALMAIVALPLFPGGWWGHGAVMTPANGPQPAEIMVPASWALFLFTAWAGIASFFLARVGIGLVQLVRLRRSCVRVDTNSLDPEPRMTLERFSRDRGATLCVSDQVEVPTAAGFFRPAVIVPLWLLQDLSAAELNQILLHELAHLQRRDDWTNLAQQIVKALFFFHPAVWWIEKKVSLEREMACDDAVLAQTACPRAYAECLAHLAEKSFVRRSLALAHAALGRVRHTSQRIAQILDWDRPASSRGWKSALPVAAGVVVACFVGVSKTPRLVAFENAPPRLAAAASSIPPIADRLPSAQAAFKPATAKSNPTSSTPRVVQATARRLNSRPDPRLTASPATELAAHADNHPAVHAVVFRPASVTLTETVFVVLQTDVLQTNVPQNGILQTGILQDEEKGVVVPVTYRIRVWHFTVLQPAKDLTGNRIPRKET